MKSTTVLVLGTGIAGLSTAIQFAERGFDVTLVAKTEVSDGATQHAQGGIASVWSVGDSFEEHSKDTIEAGAGLCHGKTVDICVREGPAQVRKLIEWGVDFSKRRNSEHYDLHKEGGHGHRRILHHADATGMSIQSALIRKAEEHPKINILSHHIGIELITQNKIKGALGHSNQCLGLYVLDTRSGKVKTIESQLTVLATGGAGKVYLYTSNPAVSTGDGIAMAYRSGARVANLEFMQFHPTCLFRPGGRPLERTFLISEAIRGEGAILRNLSGEDFVLKHHKKGSLAPRDVVARAIDFELKKTGDRHVYLDATQIPQDKIKSNFPNIYDVCRGIGIHLEKDWIPVIPAAHYSCGGVWTDLNAQTSVNRLFAVGEVACTGLHGANRLASNSLLEAVVFAERCARKGTEILENPVKENLYHIDLPHWQTGFAVPIEEKIDIASIWKEIRTLMWNYVGIVRSDNRLRKAKRRLEVIRSEIEEYYWNFLPNRDLIELRNICQIAELIVDSGRNRKESRGLHYNVDYPTQDDDFYLKDTVL